MSRSDKSLTSDYFETLYKRNPDPWNFETSDYERAKYRATLDALPKPFYPQALEIGCSIGVLTRMLAARCGRLLAIDAATQALDQARRRCADLDHVSFAHLRLPEERPNGRFDLIMLSEVLYYFDASDLDRVAAFAAEAAAPGADLILVHWTGETNYPLSGDDAAERFIAALGAITSSERRRADGYRLDVLRRP